jgi:2-methylcitrate dehydratase PrpD
VDVASVKLRVHPLTLSLTDRPQPKTSLEAQVSLQHWAAACVVHQAAGIDQGRQDCIDDPAMVAMRARVAAVADPTLARDEAVADVVLENGTALHAHVPHARGSIDRPLTDAELDDKFALQAKSLLPKAAQDRLIRLCRNVATLRDVGHEIGEVLLT